MAVLYCWECAHVTSGPRAGPHLSADDPLVQAIPYQFQLHQRVLNTVLVTLLCDFLQQKFRLMVQPLHFYLLLIRLWLKLLWKKNTGTFKKKSVTLNQKYSKIHISYWKKKWWTVLSFIRCFMNGYNFGVSFLVCAIKFNKSHGETSYNISYYILYLYDFILMNVKPQK